MCVASLNHFSSRKVGGHPTLVGLVSACPVIQLGAGVDRGWVLVVVVGKGVGSCWWWWWWVFSASPAQRANWG